MIREAFLCLQNAAIVARRSSRTVNVVLQDRSRGIDKARGRQVGRNTASRRAPVLESQSVRRQAGGAGIKRRARQQVGVKRDRQMRGVNPDVASRDRHSAPYLALYP